MRVFNLAEELEKERKKNKELEEKIGNAIKCIKSYKYKIPRKKILDILRGNNE